MLTLEQAKNNIDTVLKEVRNPALNRDEHDLLRMSLEMLYDGAKEGQEGGVSSEDRELYQKNIDELISKRADAERKVCEYRQRDTVKGHLLSLVPAWEMIDAKDPGNPTEDELKAYLVQKWQK